MHTCKGTETKRSLSAVYCCVHEVIGALMHGACRIYWSLHSYPIPCQIKQGSLRQTTVGYTCLSATDFHMPYAAVREELSAAVHSSPQIRTLEFTLHLFCVGWMYGLVVHSFHTHTHTHNISQIMCCIVAKANQCCSILAYSLLRTTIHPTLWSYTP